MFKRFYFVSTLVLLLLLLCYHSHLTSAQSQNAIGAHRMYEKTSFSCSGRGSGYYADVETGCQVYHMCDGLGRQFSYSCPNTTLFQQRMLICDHWYMVNCSKAESHYTANLLIGQRDKPFVNDEENNLRTPRPDLLDRPYAPDYSGESFRNQYQKSFPPALNQIFDGNAQKLKDKTVLQADNLSNQQVGQQRWKIPPPSRVILPPAYEPQIQNETTVTPRTTSRVTYFSTTTTTPKPATLRPTATNRGAQGVKFNNVAALHIRPDEHFQFEHDDLGTSHSTRYNTSADFNSAEDKNTKSRQKENQRKELAAPTNTNFGATSKRPLTGTTTSTKSSASLNIKTPSKIYEPPLLYPIYNINDTTTTITATTTTTTTSRPIFRGSTASPFVTRQSTAARSTTTTKAPSRATTVLGKPFTRSPSYSTTTQSGRNINDFNRFDANKLSKEIRTPAPAQGFKSPIPRPTVPSSNITEEFIPSKHLQPPFTDFIQHDVATTQGPPIYYEWKVPSDGLEPPKLDAPIGTDGREYPDAPTDYIIASGSGSFTSVSQFDIDQKKVDDKQLARTPTSRSIKDTQQPNGVHITTKSKETTATRTSTATATTHGPPALEDIFNIRKELSVPEYAFPLENVGRTGYLATDVYNSFQLKIPDRRADTNEPLHWYGENPKCPECHPSYVKPGTCEPCLRR